MNSNSGGWRAPPRQAEGALRVRGARATPRSRAGAAPRRELGAVLYEYNVLGARGPRRMMAALPAPGAGRESGPGWFRPQSVDDSVLARIKAQVRRGGVRSAQRLGGGGHWQLW